MRWPYLDPAFVAEGVVADGREPMVVVQDCSAACGSSTGITTLDTLLIICPRLLLSSWGLAGTRWTGRSPWHHPTWSRPCRPRS